MAVGGILLLVIVPAFDPREGGVKVVFDVPEDVVDDAVREITAAGFAVGRYYSGEAEHRVGGSAPGWIRLGAERPMLEFTDAEQMRSSPRSMRRCKNRQLSVAEWALTCGLRAATAARLVTANRVVPHP